MATDKVSHDRVTLPGGGLELAADRWAGGDSRGVVVLLHGGGQTRHSWRTAGERLAILGWTTYAVDLRGHGDSDWAPDGNYGLSGHLDDLMSLTSEIRRREPGQPLSLVGASLGGIVSLIAADSATLQQIWSLYDGLSDDGIVEALTREAETNRAWTAEVAAVAQSTASVLEHGRSQTAHDGR